MLGVNYYLEKIVLRLNLAEFLFGQWQTISNPTYYSWFQEYGVLKLH